MRTEIAGIPVDGLRAGEVIARALSRCEQPAPPVGGPPLTIFSCNVDMLVKADRDPAFARDLARGEIVTPDGMPVVWLMRLLGAMAPERVAGADLVPSLGAACAAAGRSVFLFGAAPGVAARAAERLVARSPSLRVAGVAAPPPGFDRTAEGIAAALAPVRAAAPDVVFVALGAPRQERLIVQHGDAFGAKVLLGIGGSLDMVAGDVRRAPRLLQRTGAEWLFRLAQEPRRLARRYLIEDPAFARIAATAVLQRRRAGRHREPPRS